VIVWPGFREAIIRDLIALDAETLAATPPSSQLIARSRRLAIRILLEMTWTYASKSLAEARSAIPDPDAGRHFKQPITRAHRRNFYKVEKWSSSRPRSSPILIKEVENDEDDGYRTN
jgi:hypothetical protein